jgi:D-glycerate 3-kinase
MTPSQISAAISRVFVLESIPQSVAAELLGFHTALIEYILHERQHGPNGLNVLGICGPQGVGKTTLTRVLQTVLNEAAGLSIAVMSLDDLYLSSAERIRLANEVHPMLRTRGVPGTHDVNLGIESIQRLLTAHAGEQTRLPRFDKSIDEPYALSEQPLFEGRADLVILEGWCVAAMPQSASALIEPVNELERVSDPEGQWRRYVNERLAGPYQKLFGMIDKLLLLRAQRFEDIYAWRLLQEQKLAAKVKSAASPMAATRLMGDQELRRFIMHFERLTRHILVEMPSRADIVAELDSNRQLVAVYRSDGRLLCPVPNSHPGTAEP